MDTFELENNDNLYYIDLSSINEKINLCNNLLLLNNKINFIKNKIILKLNIKKHKIENKNILINILKLKLSDYIIMRNNLVKYINPNEKKYFNNTEKDCDEEDGEDGEVY